MDNNKSNKWSLIIRNVLNQFNSKTRNNHTTKMSSGIKKSSISLPLSYSSQMLHKEDNTLSKKNIFDHNLKNNETDTDISYRNNITDYVNKNLRDSSQYPRLTFSETDNSCTLKDTNMEEPNSEDVFLNTNIEHNGRHPQPIMGKTALLTKNNTDHSDSSIVHSIILNKYEGILNHYVNRMYKRRASRLSNSEDEFSESSTMPRYSPSSYSSLGTPGIAESINFYHGNDKKYYSIDHLDVGAAKDNLNSSFSTCSRISTSFSEYDPKKFLVNAIGDAASMTSESHNNISNSTQVCDESVGTSRISSLISKTNSFSSLKKKLARNNSKLSCTEEQSENLLRPCSVKLDQCMKELSKQNSIIFQISKALSYCKNSKDFFIGRERIEAEKILLIATITKEALIKEINAIEFDTDQSSVDTRCTGDITISNITFKLKEKIDADQQSNYEEHFLVVLTSGKNVLSSHIIKETNGVLDIGKIFKFQELLADFEITICVYSLVMSNQDYISQGDYKCPSPKSIFKCNRDSKTCKISNNRTTTDHIAFIPIGTCHIRNSDLSHIKSNSLCLKLKQDIRSSLQPIFEIQIQTSFKLVNRLTGFLTIGVENPRNSLTWNRRWCVLDGSLLKYWNYPSEEASDPIFQIDIKDCSVDKVVLADRSLCARPKTLYLPLNTLRGGKKYFLSADCLSDLHLWESELNFVIQSFQIWRGMRVC